MHHLLFSRSTIDVVPRTRSAVRLLSHGTQVDSKRRKAGIAAVEQLKWLQKTDRPLSKRMWRVAVQQLKHNAAALHVPVDFPNLLAASAVLSLRRPLGYEGAFLQILLHHVLQRAEDAAAVLDIPSHQDLAAISSRFAAAATQGLKDGVAGATAAHTAGAELTDLQLLQLLIYWDSAAVLRPCLEALAQPLLRMLIRRTRSRPLPAPVKLAQADELSTRGSLLSTSSQACTRAQASKKTPRRWGSSDGSGAAFLPSENAYVRQQDHRSVDSRVLLNICDFFALHKISDTTTSGNNEQAVAAAQLSQELQLLKFLGRRLEELLALEQEAATATTEVERGIQLQQNGACNPTPFREQAVISAVEIQGEPAFNGALPSGECSSRSRSELDEESTPVSRKQLWASLPTKEPRGGPLRTSSDPQEMRTVPGAAAPTRSSNIACAAWRLLVHCYQSWRSYSKRFGGTENQSATLVPELALSGARILLALLQHLQALGSQNVLAGQKETGAWFFSVSETREQQLQPTDHAGCRLLLQECQVQQHTAAAADLSGGAEKLGSGKERAAAGWTAPASERARRWDAHTPRTPVSVMADKSSMSFQAHELQEQAAKLQRQLLQVPLQPLSHSEMLVQMPAAAYLLRLCHEVSFHVSSERCGHQQTQRNAVMDCSAHYPRPKHAEANGGPQQKEPKGQEASSEADAAGWRRLSLSVDQRIRKERGRRDALSLQLDDVCKCFGAMLHSRFIPMKTIGRLLRTACNQTDNLKPHQRADLESALSQLSEVVQDMCDLTAARPFLDENSKAPLGFLVQKTENRRRVLRSSESDGNCCVADARGCADLRSHEGSRLDEPGTTVDTRERIVVDTHLYERGHRLPVKETPADPGHARFFALMRLDEHYRFQGLGSGWLAADDAADDYVDRKIPLLLYDYEELSNQATRGHASRRRELPLLLDLINHVRRRKILQRRHRSTISWSCGRRDDRGKIF